MLMNIAERGWLPDWLIRLGVRRLLRARLRHEHELARHATTADFVEDLKDEPIAVATTEANAQHYEVPAKFFATVLGPRLKYSCCYFPESDTSLAAAEDAMLELTCRRAELEDGMDVLELGCGWGALSLWIAEHFPRCRVTAVSNSHSQRHFIEMRARARGLDNIRVITADMRDFMTGDTFDRVLSIEMFEHMRNYRLLLERIASWLRPGGKLFVHVFCHRELAYAFAADGQDDWMGRHFFTGGLMPSFDLLGRFDDDMAIARAWRIDGRHYARTCASWLANLDANRTPLLRLFGERLSPAAARIALQRWRMFFMACGEAFAFNGGDEWLVGHYLCSPLTSGEVQRVRSVVASISAAPAPSAGGERKERAYDSLRALGS